MEVRTLGPGDEDVLRTVRLAALACDPTAFGSTLGREETFGPDDWRRRLGPPAATFVVAPASTSDPVAMAWAVPDADELLVHLFGMWVAPDARGAGAGDALVRAVAAWALDRGAARIELTVVEGNDVAERLYRRHGFRRTGASERRERDGLVEALMALVLREMPPAPRATREAFPRCPAAVAVTGDIR